VRAAPAARGSDARRRGGQGPESLSLTPVDSSGCWGACTLALLPTNVNTVHGVHAPALEHRSDESSAAGTPPVEHRSAPQAEAQGSSLAAAVRAESVAAPTASELGARGGTGDPAAASAPPSAPLSPDVPANGPGPASGARTEAPNEPEAPGAPAPAGTPAPAGGPGPAPFPRTESASELAPASQPPSRAPSRAPSPAGRSAGAAASAGGSGAGAAPGLARPQSTGALQVRHARMRLLRIFVAGACLSVFVGDPACLCGGTLGLHRDWPMHPAAQAGRQARAQRRAAEACMCQHLPRSRTAAQEGGSGAAHSQPCSQLRDLAAP